MDAADLPDNEVTRLASLQALNVLDSDKLIAAMEKTDYVGTIGRGEFLPQGDPHVHGLKTGAGFITGLFLQWQNGVQVNLWPADLAKGKLTFPSFVKVGAN